MNREFNRQQRKQAYEKDPKARNKLMIATGVVFLLFALWMMFSTSHYTSLEFPIVSKDITISTDEKSVTLTEDEATRFVRRMQNGIRTREHDAMRESLTIKLGTGVVISLDPEKNAGTITYQGTTKSVRVDKRLVKDALAYLEEEKGRK